MNSFSNMQLQDKTFGQGFQIKRDQQVIDRYNDSLKNVKNSVDVNMFEQPVFQDYDEQGIGNIDYANDKNLQKQITIQTNKTNVLASDQVAMDLNRPDKYNPILHDGELRREQRSKHIRMQDEVNIVAPGKDTQSQFYQSVKKQQNKELKTQTKQMIDNRVQFTEKPIDLEYAKKVDIERPLLKQTIDNDMKFYNDYNDFLGRGVQDAKPEKRMAVVPLMGLQMQQDQTQPLEQPVLLHTTQGNKFQPIEQIKGLQTIIPFNDVNIGRLIQMPKDVGKFVVENIYGGQQNSYSYSQPYQSLEQIVPKKQNTFQNYSQTLITKTKNIFAPKPIISEVPSKKYIHQESNIINRNVPQISRATDLNIINTNKPNFHNYAMESRQSQNYGNDIYFQ